MSWKFPKAWVQKLPKHHLYHVLLVKQRKNTDLRGEDMNPFFPEERQWILGLYFKTTREGGFPGGTVVENPPANAGDTGSSPGPGRSHMPQSN